MPDPIQIASVPWVLTKLGQYYAESQSTSEQNLVISAFSIPDLTLTNVEVKMTSLSTDYTTAGYFIEEKTFFRNGNDTYLVGTTQSVRNAQVDGSALSLSTDGRNVIISFVGVHGKTINLRTTVQLHPGTISNPLPIPTPLPSPLLTSLVSFYNCNETSGSLLDVTGGNTLPIVSGSPAVITGKVGNARAFNSATPDYFQVADAGHTNLRFGPKTRTVTFWFRPVNLTALRTILGKDKECTINYATSGSIVFSLLDSSGAPVAIITSSTALSIGTWHFVVCKYDLAATSVSVQIDNGVIDTAIQSGVPNSGSVTAGAFSVGSFVSANPLAGAIDVLGIWDRSLTTDELNTLFSPVGYPFP